MRYFAALYSAGALLAGISRDRHDDPLPWLAVCGVAMALGLAAAARRPLLLLSAAHAGLTATWAGTITARYFHSGGYAPNPATLAMLALLCAGMAVLVAAGLTSARLARAQTSPPR